MPHGDPAEVILVDEVDRQVGLCDKLAAHQRALLHRAVSVFAFDPNGRLLIQRRALGKYHSGGLWSNSACTHPRPGESNEAAAQRSLTEELGLDAKDWCYAFPMLYRAQVGAGLVEHEYDHVFVCCVRRAPAPNTHEASATAFTTLASVQAEMARSPDSYTPWFRLLIDPVSQWRAAHRSHQA